VGRNNFHPGETGMRKPKPWALGMASREPCARCGRRVRQVYMLHDRVWNLTGVPFVMANLHIGCVEKLIGRRLTAQDFYYQDSRVKR
jgi:hypothetical protein